MAKWITPAQRQLVADACPIFKNVGTDIHIRECDTCHKVIYPSLLFPAPKKMWLLDPERIDRLFVKGIEQFTKIINCEYCNTEIFATRVKRGNDFFWLNNLDKLPHSCTDFKDKPIEVQAWGRRNVRRRATYYESGKRITR